MELADEYKTDFYVLSANFDNCSLI